MRLLFFQHSERGLLTAFQSADDLRNACQLAIDIPLLVIADYPAAGALTDIYLINGGASGDHLPFGDKLFDDYPLDGRIDVGGTGIGADLTGHVGSPGIGTDDN